MVVESALVEFKRALEYLAGDSMGSDLSLW
jgi:hypothetical protein